MTDLLTQSPFDPAKERRIVIIADWLPPDFGAVGQYMQLRAQVLAERGHDVTLVGLGSAERSVRRAGRGKGRLTEMRLAARPVPRSTVIGRLIWTLWTNLRLIAASFPSLRAADAILFTGSPPFMIHLLAPLGFLWRGRLVYRITDFYPECVIVARARPSRLLAMLLAITNFWRRRIDRFEVLGVDQRRRLVATGVADERIDLVRDGSPVSFAGLAIVEPRPADLANACVLLYSGNYGVAHEVDTVVEAYARHHREGTGRVRLWLSATGSGADEVADRLAGLGVPFHRSRPVSLDRLPALLRSPDAHLVTLKDAFVGFVMPSKIYACIQSRRPILFVGSVESDVDLLARAAGIPYWRVACGDVAALAAALEQVANHALKPSGLH